MLPAAAASAPAATLVSALIVRPYGPIYGSSGTAAAAVVGCHDSEPYKDMGDRTKPL